MFVVKKLLNIIALSLLLGTSTTALAASATGKVTTLWYWPADGLVVSLIGDLGCVTSSSAAGGVVSQLLTAKAHNRDVTVNCTQSPNGAMTITNLSY